MLEAKLFGNPISEEKGKFAVETVFYMHFQATVMNDSQNTFFEFMQRKTYGSKKEGQSKVSFI